MLEIQFIFTINTFTQQVQVAHKPAKCTQRHRHLLGSSSSEVLLSLMPDATNQDRIANAAAAAPKAPSSRAQKMSRSG